MRQTSTTRYCADAEALAALRRDNIGWGHDLECGCYRDTGPARPGLLRRALGAFGRVAQ